MKIQIDTSEKTIKVEESVNLGKFIQALKDMLPDWEKYSLDTQTIINWTNPVPIVPYRPWWEPPTTPQYPPYPWITYTDDNTTGGAAYSTSKAGTTANVLEGTFCAEI